MIDSRKLTKDFIDYICSRIEWEYKGKGYDGFMESLNEKEGYMIKDKGIEKRIQKQLYKRLNLKSVVRYEFFPVAREWMLNVRLLEDEYIPVIRMPLVDSVLPIIGRVKL